MNKSENDTDTYSIKCNENITMEMIMANPEKPWNLYNVHRNPNITLKMAIYDKTTVSPTKYYGFLHGINFGKIALNLLFWGICGWKLYTNTLKK